MKRAPLLASPIALAFCVGLAGPAAAEDEDTSPLLPDSQELRELGRLAERWMQDFAAEVAPMVERLQALIDDLDSYEAPEMLPNGDIIIRRRNDAPPLANPPGAAEDEGGISL